MCMPPFKGGQDCYMLHGRATCTYAYSIYSPSSHISNISVHSPQVCCCFTG
jgi:hypothetical protein